VLDRAVVAEAWTVRKVIGWIQTDLAKRGIESARLDADLLVAHGLKQKRIALYLDLDRPLQDGELADVRKLVERRRKFEPIAYILGEREFYGRSFTVTNAVLIPRPDTETLVEEALRVLKKDALPGRILDLCTGSGAVALTLAAELPDREVLATDISEQALAVAAGNAERLGVAARVTFREGDLFAALPDGERFAAITVNPPYIGSDELEALLPDVRDHEPRLALDAGSDALSFYRRLCEGAARFLLPGAQLLVEVGYTQGEQVRGLFASAGLVDVQIAKDLSGTVRVVRGRYVAAA
jgi:release factor glutamine methyltransferase